MSGKVRVGFRPSPALTARMARAGQQVVTRLAPWARATAQAAARAAPAAASAAAPAAAGAGVALAYLGFVAWGLYEFEWAAERGRANAFILDVKRGYARCIAYRGLGMTPTASVVDDPRPGTSAALQLGWSLGDAAWQNLTDDECAIISNEFKTRDLGPPTATELVLDWVGRGYAREPLPDPHVLVRRAAARR